MTHCTMDDLLALRASEGSVWARKHLESCEVCRNELEALYQRVAQLKALPPRSPARDRWSEIRASVVATRAGRHRRWAAWSMAAAATLAGVLVFNPFSPPPASADLAQVKAQSAALESQLQSPEAEGRVVTGRDAAVIAQLEDRIAQIDGELATQQAEEQMQAQLELWQQRVNLMNQLVQVRVVRASYVGL
ncbi:MAG TPA: hypothetical protein VFD85_11185 [Gemmatimonadales bacterium]|nr:hypothetical protein [Gemmatimonadales bacterium]